MTDIDPNKPQLPSSRIESIDVIRGLTILAMIFVNDIAGVPGTPSWMKHMPTRSDGMTFVDLVFPAFLFIVGMVMPFSIGRRLDQRNNSGSTWRHIFSRIFGLLIIGFFMVNSNVISGDGIINPNLWIIFMYLCIMIIWNKTNHRNQLLSKTSIKYFAITVLVLLIFLYRGENVDGLMQMRTHWWRILGLIGWAYIVACLIYIPLRKSQFGILGSMVLLYCFYMADEAGLFSQITFFRGFIHASYNWDHTRQSSCVEYCSVICCTKIETTPIIKIY